MEKIDTEKIMKTSEVYEEAENMLKLIAGMSQEERKSYAVFLAGVDFAKKLYGIKTA